MPTPTHNKHHTRHRQIFTQWARGFALQDLNGASIWYIQALQTMASSYTKVHSHEPLDFNIAKCGKTCFKWCKFTTPRQQKHMCHTEGLEAMATHCEIATCSLLGCKKCEFLHWNNQIHTKRHPPKHRIWHQLVFGEPTLANFYGMHKGNGHTTSWHACKTQCQHHLATRNDWKCWNMQKNRPFVDRASF